MHGRWPTNIIYHQRGAIFGKTKTSYTLIQIQSLYFNYWFENNIIVVSQLLNNDGVLLMYKEFLNTF